MSRLKSAAHKPRWQVYASYQDTSVPALGRIPSHWTLIRADGLFERLIKTVTPKSLSGTRVFHYSIPAIEETGDGIEENGDFVDSNKLILSGGELLISKLNPRKSRVLLARPHDSRTIASTEFVVLLPKRINPRFAWYLYSSEAMRQFLAARVESATRSHQRVQPDLIAKAWLGTPPPLEQVAISAFLDRETARIDLLIAKKERLLELLEEKRIALISRAVTKGLDPTVPMKGSGVGWLGAVPSHWQVKRVKWAARMESGHTPDKKVAEYWNDGNIPWVSLNDTEYLRTHDYIENTAVSTTPAGLANSSAHLLPVGTVVFSRDATIGRCGITAKPMAVSQHFIGWVCSEALIPEYLLYVFRSMTQELDRLTAGATLRTIGMPEVRTLVTPVPPRSEQERIVSFVRDRSARLEGLIGRINDAVALLREYRTALITAAVTGQIDVREELGAEKG